MPQIDTTCVARPPALRPRAWLARLTSARMPVVAAVLLLWAALIPVAGARAEGPASPWPPSQPFRETAQLWLHGPEDEALTGLARLARSGDTSAQILLGLIDKSPALQGPWLARLPRVERLALMRRPDGLSGRSWLGAAQGHPLADAWLSLLSVDAGPEVAETLARMGEARAAREAVLTLAARERLDLNLAAPPDSGTDAALPVVWPDWLDPELIYVVWQRSDESTRGHLAELVPQTHPQRGLMGLTGAEQTLLPWLETSPSAAPLRAICAAHCPDTRPGCLLAAYEALGSHNALHAMGSPAETLIAQDDFLAARRGQTATLRRILLSFDARGRRAQIQRARQTDGCLADLLMAEAETYRYVRHGSQPGAVTEQVGRSGSD